MYAKPDLRDKGQTGFQQNRLRFQKRGDLDKGNRKLINPKVRRKQIRMMKRASIFGKEPLLQP